MGAAQLRGVLLRAQQRMDAEQRVATSTWHGCLSFMCVGSCDLHLQIRSNQPSPSTTLDIFVVVAVVAVIEEAQAHQWKSISTTIPTSYQLQGLKCGIDTTEGLEWFFCDGRMEQREDSKLEGF